MRLRFQRIETVDGDVYICRRINGEPIPMEKLGLPPGLIKVLLGPNFNKGGLLLFTGSTGAGKSTTLASWVHGRLMKYGGTAWTVENPVETALHGKHQGEGNIIGTCYQTEVQSDDDFGIAIQRILRAAPNMIMVGEIRNKEAAIQCLLAGMSGHIVCSTLHSNDVQAALDRYKSWILDAGLDTSLFGDALAAVIHQTKSTTTIGGVPRERIQASPLIIAGSRNVTSIRAHLRSGDYSQLISEIDRQRNVLAQSESNGIV